MTDDTEPEVIEDEDQFVEFCHATTAMLTSMGYYLDRGEKELTQREMMHLFPVVMSYKMMVGAHLDDDGDGDSDFRVDDTLF